MTTKQIFARLILAVLLIGMATLYAVLLGFESIAFTSLCIIGFLGIIYSLFWAAKNF